MPTFHHARRVVLAGVVALATVVTAVLAAFGGQTTYPAAHVVADAAKCTGGESMDAFSLA
jgi:hypothetical protein